MLRRLLPATKLVARRWKSGASPVAAYAAEDKLTLAAIATFVIAAVPIGPDRHACLLGVRKENIFHYLIGAAAIMFAEAF